jgi:hypothetical protein
MSTGEKMKGEEFDFKEIVVLGTWMEERPDGGETS